MSGKTGSTCFTPASLLLAAGCLEGASLSRCFLTAALSSLMPHLKSPAIGQCRLLIQAVYSAQQPESAYMTFHDAQSAMVPQPTDVLLCYRWSQCS